MNAPRAHGLLPARSSARAVLDYPSGYPAGREVGQVVEHRVLQQAREWHRLLVGLLREGVPVALRQLEPELPTAHWRGVDDEPGHATRRTLSREISEEVGRGHPHQVVSRQPAPRRLLL